MASTDEMTAPHIEIALQTLLPEIDSLPELAASWTDFDEDVRWAIAIDWSATLWRFKRLSEAASANKLTNEQYARFERLVHRYEAVLPIIERLELQTIPVPRLHSRR